MSYYLFDNPKVGIIVAIIVEVLMVLSWLFAREKIRWYGLLAGPVLAGLFLLLDWMVLTNREELVETTEMVVQAAEEEQAQVIINSLSNEITMSNGLDRATVVASIQKYLAAPLIQSNFIAEMVVRDDSNENGQVEFSVRTIFDPKSRYAYASYLRSKWRFEYARGDGGGAYQITNMECLEINGQKPTRDIFKHEY